MSYNSHFSGSEVDKSVAMQLSGEYVLPHESVIVSASDWTETPGTGWYVRTLVTGISWATYGTNPTVIVADSATPIGYYKALATRASTQDSWYIDSTDAVTGSITFYAVSTTGSSVWGSITGTLSNQTDLQTTLNTIQTEINNLKNIGRFLSIWNCTTGLPATNPTSLPYAYHTGDYYRVGTVSNGYNHSLTFAGSTTSLGTYEGLYSLYFDLVTQDGAEIVTIEGAIAAMEDNVRYTAEGSIVTSTNTYEVASVLKWVQDGVTYLALCASDDSRLALVLESLSQIDTVTGGVINYMPHGATYTGAASTTVETNTVETGYVYYYDGIRWLVQSSGGGGSTQATTAIVTIAVADWNSGTTCTKSVTGVTASNIVFCDASNSDVQCTAQGAGTLTFTATTTPIASVTVKVVILT